ncbi:hypothetical protein MAM1_0257d08825 [Mucor ambiguus]|uniref:Uncharacterized protein n=1 Tax=Mucor ambiguus TaxID=91626 RepID=A0A0C9LWX8_9FUNG|nr:hypothetical protein MAM1_0257d08825 [Mucor ambiguus]
MLSLGKFLLLATAAAVYLSPWFLGVCCCCDCRSLAVLAMLFLGNLMHAFSVCCRSLAVLVLPTAAGAAASHLLLYFLQLSTVVHLLFWRCSLLQVLAFAVYCRLFAVVVLSTAAAAVHLVPSAAGVVIWNFWFVLCCVDVPIAEAQHQFYPRQGVDRLPPLSYWHLLGGN